MRAQLSTLRSLAIFCVAWAVLAPRAPAQQLVRSINGPAVGAQYGKACITIPDQNGDGYKDVLVGAPGFNQQRGAVYCISGVYLASGVGSQTLWSVAPTANQGDLFGYAVADVGDMTGDGVDDYMVGQPGYDFQTSQDVGAVRLINGVSHAAVSLRYAYTSGAGFGSSIAATGDSDGDGITEVAVGAPGSLASSCSAYSFAHGTDFLTSGGISNFTAYNAGAGNELGISLVGGFDLDGDGMQEFVFGESGAVGPAGVNSGAILISSRLANSVLAPAVIYFGQIAGERLGASVDASHDYDGDGVVDIVAGAPQSPDALGGKSGRVVVLSGARLRNQTPPYEIRSIASSVIGFDYHFGAAVRATDDLNGDGVGDFLVGAPDYFTFSGTSINHKGFVSVFSGATGARWCSIGGSTNDALGAGLAGAVDDLDGNGFREFVVAGALSDAGGTDSGVIKCYQLFPLAPSTYCTAKVNSLGCTPAISFSGSPSASSLAPFAVTASNFINQKTGLLFYSHSSAITAFQGGFKCAGDPVRRTGALNSGGSASGSDCTGAYSLDFNARIANGIDPSLVAGAEVFAQYWSRDPLSASHTSLSNAVRFVINP